MKCWKGGQTDKSIPTLNILNTCGDDTFPFRRLERHILREHHWNLQVIDVLKHDACCYAMNRQVCRGKLYFLTILLYKIIGTTFLITPSILLHPIYQRHPKTILVLVSWCLTFSRHRDAHKSRALQWAALIKQNAALTRNCHSVSSGPPENVCHDLNSSYSQRAVWSAWRDYGAGGFKQPVGDPHLKGVLHIRRLTAFDSHIQQRSGKRRTFKAPKKQVLQNNLTASARLAAFHLRAACLWWMLPGIALSRSLYHDSGSVFFPLRLWALFGWPWPGRKTLRYFDYARGSSNPLENKMIWIQL